MPKKVIYLLGSGASHAVVKNIDQEKGLLTKDVLDVIEKRFLGRFNKEIRSELTADGNDVEHLISYLEYKYDYSNLNKLRNYYQKAIVELATAFSTQTPGNLYSVLLDMHSIQGIDEELMCFMTLNYEDILEKTILNHHGYGIDYVFNPINKTNRKDKIKVFKLHGSFNWLNNRPIKISRKSAVNADKTLWIPPGVDKKKENYPFNILWGNAVEQLMDCDVLRVIGCSLSQNDWGLIPILYDIKKFNNDKKLDIEIIDFYETSQKIKQTYKYLEVIGLDENPDVTSFISNTFLGGKIDEKEIQDYLNNHDKLNPMSTWLEAKLEALINKAVDIGTPKDIAYKFYYKEIA
jgi:hypothetical protein